MTSILTEDSRTAAGQETLPAGPIDRGRADWYKDAIIYQLHVKAFQDSNDDGLGDFRGLMQRLDYIQALGVTAVWLLPFYPSPLRDDGYDISDYRSINPSYGSMKDFRAFLQEAHRRGLRVITELVINHTSDAHPWFQKARYAKPGSAARNFYVWSNTDERYAGTRIIFLDTENSNWTWDPVAKAYFWHRFYSHQPDLNFDNPRVLKEVLRVMHMWLDMGVDGLRLDAIPYLCEREGTNNENLPETHDVLKKIRANLDAHYSDRMLLAEANQWPEDTRPYFGEGDECHMGFHFPLMPRIYMALAQEDRHPITDIIRQTPEIPECCQWAIFLRNHDELTLEMVTEEERDYLWRTYAADSRARINLGIRRRLAPLLQNDRRKIELLNGLLFSMPGTPIVYYGDEIGMGDNYYLGDRDGVRTPMQWSADRNAGFSRAVPQALYLPPIMDPIYGYQAINVEAQQQDPSSILNWMRRIITVRKRCQAFGRGSISFLYPRNRKILAYLREYGDESILCVANLSRAAQAVELDLAPWRGTVPVELTGRSAFPPVGDLPYLLTLPAYGFYWFLLSDAGDVESVHETVPDPLPEFVTMTAPDGRLTTALSGRECAQLERDVLPRFLELQRWYGGKDERISKARVLTLGPFKDNDHVLATVEVSTESGEHQSYFLPLSARWGEENISRGAPTLSYTLAKIRQGPRVGAIADGAYDEGFASRLLQVMRNGETLEARGGEIRCRGSDRLSGLRSLHTSRPLGAEQSNVSIVFEDQVILKLYRRLRSGPQPELEMARFLTEEAGFPHTPAYLGSMDYVPRTGEPTTLAVAYAFVPNQGDAWRSTVDALARDLEETGLTHGTAPENGFGFPLDLGALLGQRTAEMHSALAIPTDNPALACEPMTEDDLKTWSAGAVAEAQDILEKLKAALPGLDEQTAATARAVLAAAPSLLSRLTAVAAMRPDGDKSRIHGDYHLGQVLVAQDNFVIIDFEGEPRRTIEERRQKSSPLRDVAGMLRSFDYATAAALDQHIERTGEADEVVRKRAAAWRRHTFNRFMSSYRAHIAGASSHPADEALADALLDLFLIQKAFYEVGYELANRPSWLAIPLGGLLSHINAEEADDDTRG